MYAQHAPSEHFEWIVERTGCAPTASAKGVEVVDSRGTIRAMLLADLWTPNSCQLHFAADTPIAFRTLIPCGFDYVFNQAGKGVVTAVIKSDNEKSLSMASHLGLVEVGKIWDGYSDGVDLIIMELRRENCRWLKQDRKAA